MNILEALEKYGPWGVIIVLLIIIFNNPEKVQIWASWIHIYILRRLFKRSERKSVSLELQGKINDFKNKLNKKVPGILPYGLKIKWVHNEQITKQSFLEKNDVVVILKSYDHQDVNFVSAVLIYLAKALIPYARLFLNEISSKAINFTYAKKIIKERKSKSTLDYFLNEILHPEFQRSNELKEYCSIMDHLDNNGILTSVLMNELIILSRKLNLTVPNQQIIYEVRDFILFLSNFARKKKEEIVPLNFIRRHIKISLTPIALKHKFETKGAKPYVTAIEEKIKMGIERNYVVATGMDNVENAHKIVKKVKNIDRIKNIRKITYKRAFINGKEVPAVTYILYIM